MSHAQATALRDGRRPSATPLAFRGEGVNISFEADCGSSAVLDCSAWRPQSGPSCRENAGRTADAPQPARWRPYVTAPALVTA